MSWPLKRVLFVCIGNSCRSQMAEAFARFYGKDVMAPASAGLAPARGIALDTVKAMDEKGIDLREHYPKGLQHLGRAQFDFVVNMSGEPLSDSVQWPVREWNVEDPIGLKYSAHCSIRDEIERRVMNLILELRREQAKPDLKPLRSGPSAF